MGCCRARPVPTGFQRMDRRQAIEKSRMTSAQHGEDGVLLQRAVTKRAVEMATSAAISTGVGARSHAPAQQARLRCPRTIRAWIMCGGKMCFRGSTMTDHAVYVVSYAA